MVEVATIAVPHIVRALEQEIARLRHIQSECGDDWPPDFEPNDIPLYMDVLESVSEPKGGKVFIDYPWGKPARFSMAILAGYIKKNRIVLTSAEIESLSEVISNVSSSHRP